MYSLILITFISSLILAFLLIGTARWHGRFTLDGVSGVQKFHNAPTPRIGGIAIFGSLCIVSSLAEAELRNLIYVIVVGGLPAFLAGFIEDVTKRVGVMVRLLATLLSGLLAWMLTGVAMRNTGVPLFDSLLVFTPVAVLFTAFAVGGVANAVNIIDGFNGLAIGVVLIILTALGFIANQLGDYELSWLCFIVAAAGLGFAAFNWPFGRIFLGDGGAYFLGFALAWIAVLLPARNSAVSGWVALVACSYPVLEVVFSIHRKLRRKGYHPSQPDKVHLHMLLYRRVARRFLRQRSRAIQNGMTSPMLWCYCSLSALWSVLFMDNDLALVAGLVLASLTYGWLYYRVSRFHWLPKIIIARRAEAGDRTWLMHRP